MSNRGREVHAIFKHPFIVLDTLTTKLPGHGVDEIFIRRGMRQKCSNQAAWCVASQFCHFINCSQLNRASDSRDRLGQLRTTVLDCSWRQRAALDRRWVAGSW